MFIPSIHSYTQTENGEKAVNTKYDDICLFLILALREKKLPIEYCRSMFISMFDTVCMYVSFDLTISLR